MAVAAARDCFMGFDRKSVDGLYFASASSPYREKQSASIIVAALDLRRDVFAADFSDSLGSGAGGKPGRVSPEEIFYAEDQDQELQGTQRDP